MQNGLNSDLTGKSISIPVSLFLLIRLKLGLVKQFCSILLKWIFSGKLGLKLSKVL
jgi:hypothetical protein